MLFFLSISICWWTYSLKKNAFIIIFVGLQEEQRLPWVFLDILIGLRAYMVFTVWLLKCLPFWPFWKSLVLSRVHSLHGPPFSFLNALQSPFMPSGPHKCRSLFQELLLVPQMPPWIFYVSVYVWLLRVDITDPQLRVKSPCWNIQSFPYLKIFKLFFGCVMLHVGS